MKGNLLLVKDILDTLKNKIYKHVNSVSNNVYTNKLDNRVQKFSHSYQSTFKMKPFDVNPGTYTDFDKKNNKEDPKFEVGDHVRISKYKNVFAKGYFPDWFVEGFVITKVKNTVLWTS